MRRALTAADLKAAHDAGEPAIITDIEGLDFLERLPDRRGHAQRAHAVRRQALTGHRAYRGRLLTTLYSMEGAGTAVLVRAGLLAEASSHIQTVEWSKYVLFAGGMALASLTRLASAPGF